MFGQRTKASETNFGQLETKALGWSREGALELMVRGASRGASGLKPIEENPEGLGVASTALPLDLGSASLTTSAVCNVSGLAEIFCECKDPAQDPPHVPARLNRRHDPHRFLDRVLHRDRHNEGPHFTFEDTDDKLGPTPGPSFEVDAVQSVQDLAAVMDQTHPPPGAVF
ncbi:unnamed protein product [Durusdinium trenchii]|uniref:Uncharacterized protein n=1 Tax=Durusdinium trenchii TaxID=1381693 RepID=A0ABP0SHU3_9DINO